MVEFIGVAVVSTLAWLFSLASGRSAARRHLVLASALAACLFLPAVLRVRTGTQWTLISLRTSHTSSTNERDISPIEPSRKRLDLRDEDEPRESQSSRLIASSQPIDAAVPVSDGGDSDLMPQLETDAVASPERDGSPASTIDTAGANWPASAWQWGWRVYISGAVVLLLRMLVSFLALLRVRRGAESVESWNGIAVLESNVPVPLALGLGKRAIVLPRGFRNAVQPAELLDVLAHEAEHLRRGDQWVILLERLAAAVYWPVVTVHLLNRALDRAREELCDNAVVAGRDPTSYGQTLLAVSEFATRRRHLLAHAAPTVIGRGQLERRVTWILDDQRDRRTRVSHRTRWTIVALLAAVGIITATTRVVAVDDVQTEEALAESETDLPPPNANIEWTDIPTVDVDNPILHRGVVLGPDGTPLAGASVYAASTIELFDLRETDDIGPVRAVTDDQGRFEFEAEDLSWVTQAGERKRWETLLVVTSEGIVSGWLKTWGEDRSFREHWHPHVSREVAVRTRPPASLTGTLFLQAESSPSSTSIIPSPASVEEFVLSGATHLTGARVRLTGLMAPWEYDLDVHIPQEEEDALGLFEGVDYAETLYRPALLPGVITETMTDQQGQFVLDGLPEGFIAQIEVSHPEAVTTSLRVAIRPIDPVYRQEFGNFDVENDASLDVEATPTLYGSDFIADLPRGVVLRGQVSSAEWGDDTKIAGVTVALANHNSPDGMYGQQFTTDADGRFEVTGLWPDPEGYELAFIGSFDVPWRARRQHIVPGHDADVELQPAVPYRLTLTNPEGEPIDRTVYSIVVQQEPGSAYSGVKSRFDEAEQVAPGVYEGIVPTGPGAVLVERGARIDRPIAVDPKAFFEPGRTDWTLEESRYAYGDAWRIVQPGVIETEQLAYNGNPAHEQLELSAAVFTNARREDGVLELSAIVYSDSPVEFSLVDEAGAPVHNARIERQFERYEAEDLPSTFSVHGLHPARAEFLAFHHDEHNLIGTLSTTWSDQPIRVVMRPAATLLGRFVDSTGQLDYDFGMRLIGEGVPPDTFVAGRVYNTSQIPGEGEAEFRFILPPGVEVRGEFVRKTHDHEIRPSVAPAFGPLIPRPGETVDLGDLVVP